MTIMRSRPAMPRRTLSDRYPVFDEFTESTIYARIHVSVLSAAPCLRDMSSVLCARRLVVFQYIVISCKQKRGSPMPFCLFSPKHTRGNDCDSPTRYRPITYCGGYPRPPAGGGAYIMCGGGGGGIPPRPIMPIGGGGIIMPPARIRREKKWCKDTRTN